MIQTEIKSAPDKLVLHQENAEVEIGIEEAPSGKLIFAPFPKLIEGNRLPERTEKFPTPNEYGFIQKDSMQAELSRMLLQYDKYQDSANFLARLSNLALISGQLDQAYQFASKAASLSANPEYRSRLAEIAFFKSNLEEARQIWESLADDNNLDAILRMAQLAIAESNYQIANKWIDKAVSLESTDWRTHIIAGTLSLVLNQPERSVRHFRIAVENRPRSVQLHYNLAIAHALTGSIKQSLRALRIATGLNPYNKKSLIAWSDISLYEGKNILDITRAFDRYVALYPKDKLALERLAYLKYKLGDNFGSRDALLKSQRYFDDAYISNNLGVLSARGKNIQKAILEFSQAIRIASQSKQDDSEHTKELATINLVLALNKASEFNKAESIAEEYISTSHNERIFLDEPIYRIADVLIDACLNQGKIAKGINLAHKLINIPVHPDLKSNLANTLVCYYTLVDKQLDRAWEFALQAYNIESARQPKDLNNWNISVNNIAYVSIEQGNLDQAAKFLSGFRSDTNQNRQYEYATRGLLAIRRGRIERGEGLYRLAISVAHDKDAKSLLRQKLNWELGKAFALKGDKRKAIRLLEKVLKTHVTGVWTIPFVKTEATNLLNHLRDNVRSKK